MRYLHRLFLIAAAVLLPSLALAQKFPDRPVRLVIPYAVGGSMDVVGRAIAQRFQEQTGQPMVLDNRGGAAGLIATEYVTKQPPDGYTLLLGTAAQVTIAAALNEKMAFDPFTDLVPVTQLVDTSNMLFVSTGFPAQNVQELVAMARAKPGSLTYGSSGNGSVSHLAGELFAQRLGLQLLHVPYRGAAPALTDVASGQVSMIFTTLASAKPLVDSKRLRVLAIAAPRRSAAMPSVPTLTELGFGGAESGVWIGIMAPKGTPERLVAQLHGEFAKALAAPDVMERMSGLGVDVIGQGPRDFRNMITQDAAVWQRVVKTGNIKAD